MNYGIDLHQYRVFTLIRSLLPGIVHVINAAVAPLWGFMLLHVAKAMAAPDILASAGTLVTVSIEVMAVAAFIALLEAIAILAAYVTARICMLAEILGIAAWTVFVDLARLFALIANSIAVASLAALITMLEDYAF